MTSVFLDRYEPDTNVVGINVHHRKFSDKTMALVHSSEYTTNFVELLGFIVL